MVSFVAITTAEYYDDAGLLPPISSNDDYYAPDATYQPFVQPPVHYQPFAHFQPVSSDGQWKILRDVRHQSPSGEYVYEYETENGIIANEQSYEAGPNQAQRKTGFYQYPAPDGRIIRVDYVADENGFQVQ